MKKSIIKSIIVMGMVKETGLFLANKTGYGNTFVTVLVRMFEIMFLMLCMHLLKSHNTENSKLISILCVCVCISSGGFAKIK